MPQHNHGHPGQKEPRSHGETHHENRVIDLNTASEDELAELPMVGRVRARLLREVIVQRVKLPPNYRIPPHTHSYAEVVTVLTGAYGNFFGEKFEMKGELMKPGSLFVLPAKHAHYVWTGNEGAVVQIQFIGPGGIDYINPADDPRKKTQ